MNDKAIQHAGKESTSSCMHPLCSLQHLPLSPRATLGRMRGQYKLPKYLTKWKDPEDGFAQTTNASQPDERADMFLQSVAH